MQLGTSHGFDADFEALKKVLDQHPTTVLVQGRPGTGRRQALTRLEQNGFACVQAPPLEHPDAALAVLLELAALDPGAALGRAQEDAVPLGERMHHVAACLAPKKRGVALRLSDDGAPAGQADAAEGQVALRQLRELLSGWATKGFPLVVLGGDDGLARLDVPHAARVQLKPASFSLDGFAPSVFGPLEAAAQRAATMLRAAQRRVSPLELRWWVGLVSLEDRVGSTARVTGSTPSMGVARNFASLLCAMDELRPAALRLALARRGLRRKEAEAIVPSTEPERSMLLECVAYGDEQVQMHEQLRRAFLSVVGAPRSDQQDAHRDLAKIHKQADGTARFEDSPSPRDWLDRAHHLPNAGKAGLEEWRELTLSCRQFYWDCGRSLSRSKLYPEAVEIFSECLQRFDPKQERDSYAIHYLGFNLDRAGEQPERAEAALRRAIQIEENNVWWNCRLVTFLIDRSRFLDARQEWQRSLQAIDPDGYEVARGPQLALHFHRWVARAWLEVGEVEEAREVLDGVPVDIIRRENRLRELEQRILDAEEARQLGESVYPSDVPFEDRWVRPRRLPARLPGGERLRHWYPGRVVEAGETGVVLVFAVPAADPSARRTKLRELTAKQWGIAARRPASEAKGFIEIGSYGDRGKLHIEVLGGDREQRYDIEHETRHLRRWPEPA